MSRLLLAIILLVTACGAAKRHEANDGLETSDLVAKRELYASLQPSVADADGFVEVDTCDSIHWSALTAAVTRPINLASARDPSGAWHRRPLSYEECYPKHSKSTISRDALLFVLAYAVAHRDSDIVEGVFSYGRENGWVMGAGPLSRTWFTPNMRALYAEAVADLGGKSHGERYLPVTWSASATGYEAHLGVVSVLIYARLFGGVGDSGLSFLKAQWERQPRNPLFAAAYFRFSGDEAAREAAVTVLRDERLFPSSRLPTSDDRKESWLVQRDEGADWLPCVLEDKSPCPKRVHNGGDFLWTEAVLSGRF